MLLSADIKIECNFAEVALLPQILLMRTEAPRSRHMKRASSPASSMLLNDPKPLTRDTSCTTYSASELLDGHKVAVNLRRETHEDMESRSDPNSVSFL